MVRASGIVLDALRAAEIERLPMAQWAEAIKTTNPPLDQSAIEYLRDRYTMLKRIERRKRRERKSRSV